MLLTVLKESPSVKTADIAEHFLTNPKNLCVLRALGV